MRQQTGPLLVIVNPELEKFSSQILMYFDKIGDRTHTKDISLTVEELEKFYENIKGEKYFDSMILDLENKSMNCSLYEGNYSNFNVGKEHIRRKYNVAIKPHKFYQRNGIYVSSDLQSFKREWVIVNKFFEKQNYR